MTGVDGDRRAPDIFTALGLPTHPSAAKSTTSLEGVGPRDTASAALRPRARIKVETIEDTAPRGVGVVPPPAERTASSPGSASAPFSGLADLLEPSDVDEPASSHVPPLPPPQMPLPSDLVAPIAPIGGATGFPAPGTSGRPEPLGAPASPPVEAHGLDEAWPSEDEPVLQRSGPGAWPWIAVATMLAGAMGWVLHTQTDLFSGDVIEHRREQALAEATAELEAEQAKREQVEYGTVQLDSTPDGARVWMVRPGPVAEFENLPVVGEYMVAAYAPGHRPAVRLVAGSELARPVVFELEPLDDPAAALALPSERPPRLEAADDDSKTAILTLETQTEGASLALLVGYTPGATVRDLDVSQTHRFLVTKEGHEPRELELRGRHWDEMPEGGLGYIEHFELQPREEVPDPEREAAAGEEAEAVVVVDEEAQPEAEPEKRTRKKRKRRRSKRKRRRR